MLFDIILFNPPLKFINYSYYYGEKQKKIHQISRTMIFSSTIFEFFLIVISYFITKKESIIFNYKLLQSHFFI
ncbi:hypothetical protein COE25_22930 [Bacillus sp. AFS031507]|nr:hypothetical protein COE25_22930 [Bacillus sp. AFS031507]